MQKKVQEKAVAILIIVIVSLVALKVVIDYLTLPGLLAIAAAVAVVISFERHHKAKVAHREQVLAAIAHKSTLPEPPAMPMTVALFTSVGHLVVHVGVFLGMKATSGIRTMVRNRRTDSIAVKAVNSGRKG
jgi:hypothetical protein